MTAPSGEWMSVGDVSADHGEILIIANHGVPAPPDEGAPWDRFIGYKVITSERSPDGATETIVADLYSPGWESPTADVPGHVREDVLIVRAARPSAYDVEARACQHPGHNGWCELRIKLHDHVGDDHDDDGPSVADDKYPV